MTYFLFLALVGSSSWFSSVAIANSGSSLLIADHKTQNKSYTHTAVYCVQEWLQGHLFSDFEHIIASNKMLPTKQKA